MTSQVAAASSSFASFSVANHSHVDRRTVCPVCESSDFHHLYECPFDQPPISDYLDDFYSSQGNIDLEYLRGASYVLLQCSHCDLIFQRDILNETLMERLYEHWIDPQKAKSRHLNADFPVLQCWRAQEILRVISYFRKPPSSLRFLDFGMGWGEWVLLAKGFGCEAYGAELSTSRILYAQSKGIAIHNLNGDLKFDFINTEQVFEHLPDPLKVGRQLRAMLKPGGILKINVPNGANVKRKLRYMKWSASGNSRFSLNAVAPLEHINCFQRGSLLKLANALGLHEVKMPILTQLSHVVHCGGPTTLVKSLCLPLYRSLWPSTYALFRRAYA